MEDWWLAAEIVRGGSKGIANRVFFASSCESFSLFSWNVSLRDLQYNLSYLGLTVADCRV